MLGEVGRVGQFHVAAQQRRSSFVTALGSHIERRLACGIGLGGVGSEEKHLGDEFSAAICSCHVQGRVFCGAGYDVDISANVVQPLQVVPICIELSSKQHRISLQTALTHCAALPPVGVVVHGHLVQHTPVTRHDVDVVLAHHSHAQLEVAGFGGFSCSGKVGGGGGRVLEAAPGDGALCEELAWDAAAAASAGRIEGKRVDFGWVPIETVLVGA